MPPCGEGDRLHGRSQRVKAPTALPRAMECASAGGAEAERRSRAAPRLQRAARCCATAPLLGCTPCNQAPSRVGAPAWAEELIGLARAHSPSHKNPERNPAGERAPAALWARLGGPSREPGELGPRLGRV